MSYSAFYIERIKQIMAAKKMSYKDLAQAIGKTENTIVNYFKQRSKIDVDTLIRIAEALEISPDILLKENVNMENFLVVSNSGSADGAKIHITKHTPASEREIELKAEVEKLEQRVESLKEIIDQKNEMIEHLKSEIEQKNQTIKGLQDTINKLVQRE